MPDYLNKMLLNPSFSIRIKQSKDLVLEKFVEKLNNNNCEYCKELSANHILIDITEKNRTLWSPQLILYVKKEKNGTRLRSLFKPKKRIWSSFLFLHSVIAVVFLVFTALTYTNYSAKNNYSLWFGLMLLCVLLWFVLYSAVQLGKYKAKYQMDELKDFLKDCLIELEIE